MAQGIMLPHRDNTPCRWFEAVPENQMQERNEYKQAEKMQQRNEYKHAGQVMPVLAIVLHTA
jgi:hypothetical protein